MERWMTRGDCFYARFQDDIVLISRKRYVLKRMRRQMYQILEKLRYCWRTWCTAGLPFKIVSLDDTVQHIETTAVLSRQPKQEQSLVGVRRVTG